jgi:hypothetical protein
MILKWQVLSLFVPHILF